MSSDQEIIKFSSDYPIYIHILTTVGIMYFGIFIMISNHYLLRPRIQKFLSKILLQSITFRQLTINFMSNLSALSFLFSSILLTNNDQGLATLILTDSYWATICLVIVAYRAKVDQPQPEISFIVVIKNCFIVLAVYSGVSYHYISNNLSFSLGCSLFGGYIVSLLSIVYENKLVDSLRNVFNLKTFQVPVKYYNHQNQLPSIEYLSTHFPVSHQEILQSMERFKPRLLKIELKTKSFVTQKLLQIALAINNSKLKMENQQKKVVRQYYGSMNGTLQRKNSRRQGNIQTQIKDNFLPNQYQNEYELDSSISNQSIQDSSSILLVFFPVKLFQSSKIISTVISILLNIIFGICLNFAINIAETFQYGCFFKFFYAILLLPIIPSTNKTQYFNTMCLSSIWRYGLCGLSLLIWAINYGANLTLVPQKYLQVQFIIIGGVVLVSMIGIKFKTQRIGGLLFCFSLISNLVVIYFSTIK